MSAKAGDWLIVETLLQTGIAFGDASKRCCQKLVNHHIGSAEPTTITLAWCSAARTPAWSPLRSWQRDEVLSVHPNPRPVQDNPRRVSVPIASKGQKRENC
jgi:hypothetical protein